MLVEFSTHSNLFSEFLLDRPVTVKWGGLQLFSRFTLLCPLINNLILMLELI